VVKVDGEEVAATGEGHSGCSEADQGGEGSSKNASAGTGVVETEKERRHRLQMKSKGMVRRLQRQEEWRKKMDAEAAAKETAPMAVTACEPGDNVEDSSWSKLQEIGVKEVQKRVADEEAVHGEQPGISNKVQKFD
jgi:hypothetical protein